MPRAEAPDLGEVLGLTPAWCRGRVRNVCLSVTLGVSMKISARCGVAFVATVAVVVSATAAASGVANESPIA